MNAPLYYLLMHLWAGVFGLSDAALRAPSLICATLTPLAIALIPVEGLGRRERLAWGAVVALWFPALCFAQEARGYALLLLVSTLQMLAFLRLLARPTLRRASIWAALGAVAILTHYDALFAGMAQGLVYLAAHRLRAARTWPAALAFAPAFGWLAFHWPRIQVMARPDIAWYAPLKLSGLGEPAAFAIGCGVKLSSFLRQVGLGRLQGGRLPGGWLGIALGCDLTVVALGGLGLALMLARLSSPRDSGQTGAGSGRGAWLGGVAAVLGAAAVVGMGLLRPSFTFRYLTPFAPGVLLGVVLAARAMAGRRHAALALCALVALYAATSGWCLIARYRMAPRRYAFEAASADLAHAHPTRLVFLWDHPVTPVLHREQLAAFGGFFLHRAGAATEVSPVVLAPGADPNRALAARAESPGSVILWLYDTAIKGTAAARRPPAISALDPAWRCRQYGAKRFGVVACRRASSGR